MNTEKPGIVNIRDKTDNAVSSFCTVFDVYVAFRLAVLIEMHRYSSSNLNNYFGFGGHVSSVPPWILKQVAKLGVPTTQ